MITDFELQEIAKSNLFTPAELVTVGYDNKGNAITEWQEESV